MGPVIARFTLAIVAASFPAMLIFCLLWTLFAYVPVADWVWDGGWLSAMGVMDFAGGTVVHVNADVATGLGTITPALGFVGPMGALIIGASAGFTCYWATQLVKQRWVIDDSLDVFSMHGIGGALGMLLTGVLVMLTLGGAGLPEGISLASQFGVQALAVVATAAWSALVSYLALKVAGAVVPLRVGVDEEIERLDRVNHEERGYNF